MSLQITSEEKLIGLLSFSYHIIHRISTFLIPYFTRLIHGHTPNMQTKFMCPDSSSLICRKLRGPSKSQFQTSSKFVDGRFSLQKSVRVCVDGLMFVCNLITYQTQLTDTSPLGHHMFWVFKGVLCLLTVYLEDFFFFWMAFWERHGSSLYDMHVLHVILIYVAL